MKVSNDNGCLVCGRDNPIGLQTKPQIDRETGRAILQVVIPRRFQGWSEIAHGGILTTLLDEVSIYACMSQGSQFVTAGINVRFLKPVPVEREVVVQAEVVETRRRRRTVHARLELDGELYAEAETKVVELRPAQTSGEAE